MIECRLKRSLYTTKNKSIFQLHCHLNKAANIVLTVPKLDKSISISMPSPSKPCKIINSHKSKSLQALKEIESDREKSNHLEKRGGSDWCLKQMKICKIRRNVSKYPESFIWIIYISYSSISISKKAIHGEFMKQ